MLSAKIFTLLDMNPPGELISCANGSAVVFTTRAPGKLSQNEDSCALFNIDQNDCVLAVADGMGGLPMGQTASAIVVDNIESQLRAVDSNTSGFREAILNSIETANQKICQLAVGAGSTAAIVEISDDIARPYHVGDSKILIIGQKGKIKLETISHSPVEYAVEAGYLDAEEAIDHKDRHYITNMVGADDMRIEMGSPIKLAVKDTVLIASDGLYDNLRIEEIVETVRKGSLITAAEALIQQCAKRMSQSETNQPSAPDDLTFVLYRMN
ncbi:PP2C family protein-serine/threonine phosphatase [Kaarinaea lacus]